MLLPLPLLPHPLLPPAGCLPLVPLLAPGWHLQAARQRLARLLQSAASHKYMAGFAMLLPGKEPRPARAGRAWQQLPHSANTGLSL